MTAVVLIVIAVVGLMVAVAAARVAKRKNVDIILRARRRPRRSGAEANGPRHIFFCVADHFEPFWQNRDVAVGAERVNAWCRRYPALVDSLRDNGGRAPRHVFFYPQEEYPLAPQFMEQIADLVHSGLADVEVHLHHDRDTADGLREKIISYTRALHDEHGLLRRRPDAELPSYAFIHGNWTLADSGPRHEYCGVPGELAVLQETGCYADFTYPSAPHPTQPPLINRIYYASALHERRAHHRGIDARYGTPPRGEFLLFTGPLALNWRRHRYGLMPAVENGDLTHLNPPGADRTDAWIETAVGVEGFPRWIFVKAYTHGAQERISGRLLSDGPGGLAAMYRDLLARYNDGERYVVHFSTPWEMYRCVKALEAADEAAIAAIERFDYSFSANGL